MLIVAINGRLRRSVNKLQTVNDAMLTATVARNRDT
jgi:hypothetical protein